ncbi:MAG: hypothetical protein Q7W29_08930 [bacterium]|nr:hypothetical protein [bacterium]
MTHRRLRTLLSALALPLLGVVGCGGGGDGGPVADRAHVAATVLVDPAAARLHDAFPDWTQDDRLVIFNGPPGGNVWRVEATGGSPVALTDTLNTSWTAGAYKPGCLAEGRVAFYQVRGTGGDRAMHIMAVDTAAVAGVPAPTTLRRFTGTAVGLSGNQTSEPQTLSFSRYSRRLVGLWRTPWLMEWGYEELTEPVVSRSPVLLREATDVRISRDGLLVAFVDAEKRVSWMEYENDDDTGVTVIGEGVSPSWSGDGAVIGYLDNDGDYVVYALETAVATVYEASTLQLSRPVLSWAGDRIAYLARNNEKVGLAVGTLVP